MKIVPSGLAGKLILALTALVTVITGIFAFITVREQQRELINQVIEGTSQLSQSVTSATWHMMLLDKRDAAYNIMKTIGQSHDVDLIRFMNKEGRITFSTDPNSLKQVDKNAEACFLCHAKEKPLVRVNTPSRARIFRREEGGRKLGMVTPIYNEPECSSAPCHEHPPEQTVLGVLDIVIPIDHIDAQAARIQGRAILMSFIEVILVSLLIALLTRHLVAVPIKKLIAGTKAVSVMKLGTPIQIHTGGELEELAESFNMMQARLSSAMHEIGEFTQQLEVKVQERTQELTIAHQRLIQSDRLVSLGQLAATVAHEINNPVSSVLNLSMVLQRLLREDGIPADRLDEFRKYLGSITEETTRVGRIVTDLLAFSRRSSPRRTEHDVNRIIQDTVSLLSHKLRLSNASIALQLDPELPQVRCDGSQIEQVVVNLVMNAAEALQGAGQIEITSATDPAKSQAVLRVTDSGVGIAPDTIARIFDPFFTTKEIGRGVGLGLSVVHGIVTAHGGTIEVDSAVGRGTKFTVRLPIYGNHTNGSNAGSGIESAERMNNQEETDA